MSEWTDERLQRLDLYRGGDEQLRSDIRAALDTISAQFRRAETAEATLSVTEQDRPDAHAAKEKAEAEVARLTRDIALVRGAMSADDKRLEDAAIRVWGEHRWGCDTPDLMADTVIDLRAEVARLRDVERLAAIQHDIWSHWMRWFFDNDTPENRERWKRQMATTYAELSESERESDRRVVREFCLRGEGGK